MQSVLFVEKNILQLNIKLNKIKKDCFVVENAMQNSKEMK
nr:MAG TPA: hypothetical protein [Caudoviricetes sp.]